MWGVGWVGSVSSIGCQTPLSAVLETAHNPKESLWELGLSIVLRSEQSMWENDSLMNPHHCPHFKLLTVKA